MQKRLLTSALILGWLAAFWPLDRARAADWQIVKVANRDYLTLANIAQFYALHATPRLADNHAELTDGRSQIELTGDVHQIVINGVKQWLSFPILYQNGQILISRFDLAKTIEPCLRPTMIANLAPFHTVVLDAGHGGVDRGAKSAEGWEKDYTLDVIHDLKKDLEAKGFRVVLTRIDDTFIPLNDRAQTVNDSPDSIFVSVHFNYASDGGAANGFEVYAMTPRGAASTGDSAVSFEQFKDFAGNDFDNASLALATCVHYSLLGHVPQADRGVKRARFAVLRLSHAPAVLVEGGFLTNAGEGAQINDAAWRQKLADSIATGVQSFQQLSERRRPPKLLADYRSELLPLAGTIVDPAALAARTQPTGLVVPVANLAPGETVPTPPAPPAAASPVAPPPDATPVTAAMPTPSPSGPPSP